MSRCFRCGSGHRHCPSCGSCRFSFDGFCDDCGFASERALALLGHATAPADESSRRLCPAAGPEPE